MSLTKWVKFKVVKDKINELFETPEKPDFPDIKAPALTKHYTLVGTAFDYLFRFKIQKHNQKAEVRDWVAEGAIDRANQLGMSKYADLISNHVDTAKDELDSYLNSGELTDELIESSILLAKSDELFRSGRTDALDYPVDEKDVEDLRNLINLVNPDDFMDDVCFLNPVYSENHGGAGLFAGGADSDIIIGDTLIDLKTTIKSEFKKDYFYQLIGYFLLNWENQFFGESPSYDIKNLGIYFSRHGLLFTFSVMDIAKETEAWDDLDMWLPNNCYINLKKSAR